MNLTVFGILFGIFGAITCKNILFLSGIASPSHHLWNRVLIKGLAHKGFNVTMVSVDNYEKPEPNIHYVFMEKTYETLYGGDDKFDIMEMTDRNPFDAIKDVSNFYDVCCDGIINSKGLDIILNYPDDFKFDVVVYDFTSGPCFLPLIHKFKYPPLVSVTAFNKPPYTQHVIGGHNYPSYVPHYTTDFPQLMSFPQRLYNTIIYMLDAYDRQYNLLPKMEKKLRDRLNFKDFPSLDTLERKTKLVLVNTDDAIDFPEPLQSNVIQVGGLQITPPKQLPDNLLNFIESSKKGTVLMSLGTNIKSNMLGKEMLTSILKTFALLSQYNFIWKFESEAHELPIKLTENVLVAKFLPQNDILAHPKVKAFITHSGLLSTQESLWYGKPMIAMPFFCDQVRSAAKAVRNGAAVIVNFKKLNVDNFKDAILTILETPSYQANAKRISTMFQDKPQRPLDVALWWIDYVIRNPTAPQFESPTFKLGDFAANSYDVILALVLIIHLTLYFTFKVIKRVTHCFTKTESKKLKRN